jgi:hypothetical protein
MNSSSKFIAFLVHSSISIAFAYIALLNFSLFSQYLKLSCSFVKAGGVINFPVDSKYRGLKIERQGEELPVTHTVIDLSLIT